MPAFSAAKATSIIQEDLGQPVEQLFKTFDPQPIAAASLGQVCMCVYVRALNFSVLSCWCGACDGACAM